MRDNETGGLELIPLQACWISKRIVVYCAVAKKDVHTYPSTYVALAFDASCPQES